VRITLTSTLAAGDGNVQSHDIMTHWRPLHHVSDGWAHVSRWSQHLQVAAELRSEGGRDVARNVRARLCPPPALLSLQWWSAFREYLAQGSAFKSTTESGHLGVTRLRQRGLHRRQTIGYHPRPGDALHRRRLLRTAAVINQSLVSTMWTLGLMSTLCMDRARATVSGDERWLPTGKMRVNSSSMPCLDEGRPVITTDSRLSFTSSESQSKLGRREA
jgi:hypothetical protein